ncbi:hypothetical protein Tco_0248428 [Tanacetum coccineum]
MLTKRGDGAHLDKEEKLEKAAREAMLKQSGGRFDELTKKKKERLKETPEELGIRSSLPDPGQVLSLTLGRKRKHQELEPEVRIPGLECNISLPEGVSFVKNLMIEHPENRLFFIDVFGDAAFQRINGIHKVDVDLPCDGFKCQYSNKSKILFSNEDFD